MPVPFYPVLNMTFEHWFAATVPPIGPPDAIGDCQFYVGSKGILDITPNDYTAWVPPIYLRVAKGADIRVGGVVRVPTTYKSWYKVRWVEQMHLGFDNEYRAAVLEQVP